MEKSCSALQLFILSNSINLKALTFRLLLANDVERIFEYILNRNSYGHATWPTNRYSHGKKYLRRILDVLEDSVLNPDFFTIYFTNLKMSLFFYCEDVHRNDQPKSKYNQIEIKKSLMEIK